jgi:hypothetical protein
MRKPSLIYPNTLKVGFWGSAAVFIEFLVRRAGRFADFLGSFFISYHIFRRETTNYFPS